MGNKNNRDYLSNDGSEKATQPNTNENITEDINKSNSEENKNQPNLEEKEKNIKNSSENKSFVTPEIFNILNNYGNNETSENNMIFFDEEQNQTSTQINIKGCYENCDIKKKIKNDNISNSKKKLYIINYINKIFKNKEKLEDIYLKKETNIFKFMGKLRKRVNFNLKSNKNYLQKDLYFKIQSFNHKSKKKKIKLYEDINYINFKLTCNYFKHDLNCENTSEPNELNLETQINNSESNDLEIENNNFVDSKTNELYLETQINLENNNDFVNNSESNDLEIENNNFVYSENNELNLESQINLENNNFVNNSESNDLENLENNNFVDSETNELYLESQRNNFSNFTETLSTNLETEKNDESFN